jgi:GAF domain-containing protein
MTGAFLRTTGWVIEVDEARRDPAKYRNLRLPAWLQASVNAWLVVPLTSADDLVGFVVLGRPRVSLTLDWEVLDLLKTAGRQTAGHLAQAQATEALLESRKFESFNRMSAFVVHDLKNLVAQLQLMLATPSVIMPIPSSRRTCWARSVTSSSG